jgi:molybdopterin-guanine dinucleotide biosynthesis protein A
MLSISIQAGGQSKRMGENKALIHFHGELLIQRVLNRVRSAGDDLFVTTNQPEMLRFLGENLVSDYFPGKGGLGGLYTALRYAKHPYVAVVACDMPFVSLALLKAEYEMISEDPACDVVIPNSGEGLEPFHAVYRKKTCLTAVEKAIRVGKKRLIGWLQEVNPRILTVEEIRLYDPEMRAFMNINTKDDLFKAERMNLE